MPSLVAVICLVQPCWAVEFDVTLGDEFAETPVSGRLFVFLSANRHPEPRLGPNWFKPEPFFAVDVVDMQPGSTHRINASADGFPTTLDKLAAGTYYAQALLDRQLDSARRGRAPGNYYSGVVRFVADRQSNPRVALELDSIVPDESFPVVGWLREVVLLSPMLSKFHGFDVYHRAGVVLPAGYLRNPDRRYPVIYSIPGFGGTHRDALRHTDAAPEAESGEVEFIRVMLSGDCAWGHHCFADSATNGPRGQALVEELIPYLDQTFRTVDEPRGRFLTGHSSGGWSSLWVQVNYPDVFDGTWSTAPDPVDFRDFQQIDLYRVPPSNMYRDAHAQRRPIARKGNEPVLWYDSFTKMDDVLKRGGQLRSFEAVFSPKGSDGEPMRMWDRKTGIVDAKIAESWKPYDIRLKLQHEWPTLGPKLRGKLHVIMGGRDTFYLEGACRKLAVTLADLRSDAKVEIVPDKDHSNLMIPQMYARLRREMSDRFRAYDRVSNAEPAAR